MEITLTTVGIIAVVALVISLATAIPVSQSGIATLGVGAKAKGHNATME